MSGLTSSWFHNQKALFYIFTICSLFSNSHNHQSGQKKESVFFEYNFVKWQSVTDSFYLTLG